MKITILQTDIKWGDPIANAFEASKLLEQVPGSDLYVLPEMWSTGFITDPAGMADNNGWSLDWMRETAQKTGAAICGSVAVNVEEEGESVYRNRFYFVKANGSVTYYDKRHLFAYGGENLHYKAGERRVVVELCGIRWLLLVCYDLRFPVWSRYDGDYDGIILVANWPKSRIGIWQLLLRARAIENQAVVVGANRVGKDPNCDYCGRSAIIDAKGNTLAELVTDKVGTLTAEVCKEEITRFRHKFRVLEDRD